MEPPERLFNRAIECIAHRNCKLILKIHCRLVDANQHALARTLAVRCVESLEHLLEATPDELASLATMFATTEFTRAYVRASVKGTKPQQNPVAMIAEFPPFGLPQSHPYEAVLQ